MSRIKNLVMAALIWLLCISPILAQYTPPPVAIVGIESPAPAGELMILSAEVKDTAPDLIGVSFRWTVLDQGKKKKFFSKDGEREIAFATGMSRENRTILVLLDVNYQFAKKVTAKVGNEDREVYLDVEALSPDPILAEIVVNGVNPSPPGPNPPGPQPPGPNPPGPQPPGPNPPAPVIPDGKYGLGKFVYQSLLTNDSMVLQEKVAVAKALSTSFLAMARQIPALQQYRSIENILKDTKTNNQSALSSSGVSLAKMEPFKKILGDRINQLYRSKSSGGDGTLSTPEDFSAAWTEISQGLDAVSTISRSLQPLSEFDR